MTDQIKTILEKNGVNCYLISQSYIDNISNAIIEICEEQKNECATIFDEDSIYEEQILNSKNIAE